MIAISVHEAYNLLHSRYNGLPLPGGLDIGTELLQRMQYTVTFAKNGDKEHKLEMLARYGMVEFKIPYGETLTGIDPKNSREVLRKINELADEGYHIVSQELMFGMVDNQEYEPT